MQDDELIRLCHLGDVQAQNVLMDRYKTLVKAKARSYFLIGADREDIIQEGMIGLYKAVRDYREERSASFHAFAELCINRQIISAIKAATRQKHIPLNTSLSLNKTTFDDASEQTYMDMLQESEISNPETLFIGQEDKVFIETRIGQALSKFEYQVLALYLQGKTYFEISEIVGKPEKSIDNALQRVKKKVEKIIFSKRLDEQK